MNKYHREILLQIKDLAKTPSRSPESKNYHGTSHHHYLINVPMMNLLAKKWVKDNKNISVNDLLSLLDSLNAGESYEEKNLVGKIIEELPHQRSQISPDCFDQWLDNLEGWAEVDSLCQGKFTDKDVLSKWDKWEKILLHFSEDKNISKRRASLVLLTGPVSHNSDMRLARLSFIIIEKLKHEKDILITKAISWLLRSLIKLHKNEVENYVNENLDSLPKIAIRETKRKLLTGKK